MTAPLRRSVPSAVVSLAAVALLLLATACGDDDDTASDADDDRSTTTRPTTTQSDEEPPGTEPTEVQPYIEDLLRRYDEIVNQIVGDPAVASNTDHELYGELRALMSPDSDMTEAIVGALARRGEQGISQRPYEEGDLTSQRALDGDIETVSENEISFPTCTRLNYRLYNSQDQQTGFSHDRAERGAGQAVRVDGHWRINRLDSLDEVVGCQETS